jgi:hypothetical protein
LTILSGYRYLKVFVLTLLGAVLLSGVLGAQQPEEQPTVKPLSKGEIGTRLFLEQIQPLLEKNCLGCHSTTAKQAGLDLSSRQGLLEGGKDGPAVVPGNGKGSLLYRVITHSQQPAMPPQEETARSGGSPHRPLDRSGRPLR